MHEHDHGHGHEPALRIPAGPGVLLRPWRTDDASELQQQAADRRVWVNMRDAFPHPYRLEHAEQFIARAAAMSPQTYFAIEVDGHVAGGIGFILHGDVERIGAEVGYWLGPAFWGRGIAAAALRALSAHAFAAHAGLERLYAVPFSSNPRSRRVLEKAGYGYEGTLRRSALKDGQVLDQWLYALLRGEGP